MSLITACLLLVLIPYATSISFNLTNIIPKNSDKFRFDKDAHVSNEGIQVTLKNNTSNSSHFAGRATYFELLHLWDKSSGQLASFNTEFSFVISSNGSRDFGDGLTFFLAENNTLVSSGGALGLPINETTYNMSSYRFVAVEFDTFGNNVWDKATNISVYQKHVGIDVNSLVSVTSQQWDADVKVGVQNRASINYDSLSKTLDVVVSNTEHTFIKLDHTIDFSKVLPEWVIFGFSAATGNLFETNTVKSWNFSSSELQVEAAPPPASQPPNMSQQPTTSHNGSGLSKHKTMIVVGMLSVGLFVVLAFAFFLWRKRNKGEEVDEDAFGTEMNKDFEMGTGPKRFSYHELVKATSGFVETNKLGQGGFGGVYKGFLKDLGTYVAVKRVSKTSEQGIKEYASEVKIISQLRHRNLVELKGWCHEKGELLLVYEYLENGSLDLHLFNGKSLLTWATRYRIAHGIASALLYLHEEWEKCVLHRDIKSSNVILDSKFNAKLGDFGLAKMVDHDKGSQTTMLAGTLGYMAPECAVTGKASKESDVFSFGVVVLEIACGRKPFEYNAQKRQIRLPEWVWEHYGNGTLLDAVDQQLGFEFEEEEIIRLMILGLWCVHPDSEFRPSMRQVVQVLNSQASLPTLPSKMPVASYLTSSLMSTASSSTAPVSSTVEIQSSSTSMGTI
ncbi:L-type lectin-domain containing receptor kinase IX.1-like [Rutidosis leptorrhynchoides]|uniref:L-type lectin-domain containing receptor kinase IX.1-like n=1 Tax=Rutidosis leptorrhynchoides TaxID=125765 RepID=UPI003A99727F